MLRINLLPVRQLKKRAKAKRQIGGMLFLFIGVLALLAAGGWYQAQNIKDLRGKVATLEKVKKSYAPTLKKIATLKKNREEFDRKTSIIKQLKQDSSLTVRVLDEVARKIDNKRMWLLTLQQENTSLRLSGVALDNRTIAQFMDSLKSSEFVRDVSLTSSSLKVVAGKDLKSFALVCAVSPPSQTKNDTAGDPKTN